MNGCFGREPAETLCRVARGSSLQQSFRIPAVYEPGERKKHIVAEHRPNRLRAEFRSFAIKRASSPPGTLRDARYLPDGARPLAPTGSRQGAHL